MVKAWDVKFRISKWMPGSLHVSSNEMQITFITFFIKDLNTVKQTKTKNIISRLIKARKKEPDHVE